MSEGPALKGSLLRGIGGENTTEKALDQATVDPIGKLVEQKDHETDRDKIGIFFFVTTFVRILYRYAILLLASQAYFSFPYFSITSGRRAAVNSSACSLLHLSMFS